MTATPENSRSLKQKGCTKRETLSLRRSSAASEATRTRRPQKGPKQAKSSSFPKVLQIMMLMSRLEQTIRSLYPESFIHYDDDDDDDDDEYYNNQ